MTFPTGNQVGIKAAPGAPDAQARAIAILDATCGASSADQHSVALFGEKVAPRQIADQRLVDRVPAKSKSSTSLASGSLAIDVHPIILAAKLVQSGCNPNE
jgi:hypothetical protein